MVYVRPDLFLALYLIQVSGEVSYNECKLEDLNSQKISAYISQYDLHTPEMTVRETIDFSARCQGVESRKGGKFLPSRIIPGLLVACKVTLHFKEFGS